MQPIRFILLGGFLGAGKTTTIARLAGVFASQGKRVAVITNDHASELVDTQTLRSLGFTVGEIPGACFCGNLDALIEAVEQASPFAAPDVVFVEPVGSCTDIVATVIRPLKRVFARQFTVAPYGVLLKPHHGTRILRGEAGGGFSPQAEYVFRQQLEEADFVVINRIDQFAEAQIDELESLLGDQYPGVPVVRASAKTGQGTEAILSLLNQQGEFGNRVLALDYERYAQGEADLGWLNSSLMVQGRQSFMLDVLLLELVRRLQASLAAAQMEPAHLKVIGQWEGAFGVANLIASHVPPDLSLASNCRVPSAHLTLNARVAGDPNALEACVSTALREAADFLDLEIRNRHTQCFRPGEPIRLSGFTAAQHASAID